MEVHKKDSSRIIVLLAHFNDNERLKKAIESIDEEILVDILIIDDGSKTKPNEKELQEIYGNRGILTVKILEQNQGVERARNISLDIAKTTDYEFIGVMDSDDLNKKNRFYKQISFLDANPSIKLVGGWADCVNEEGGFLYTLKHPTEDKEIKRKMYINSRFIHPTVIFRKEILNTIDGYPEKFTKGGVGDFAFLFKVTKSYEVANISEPLIDYTIRNGSLSSKQRYWQVYNRIRVILDNFYFGVYPILGVLRNIPLLITSRSTAEKIKKYL